MSWWLVLGWPDWPLPGGLWRALVAEAMAAALGERVVLGRPVRRIEHAGTGVRVIARDGSAYRGDAAIVTLPPTLARPDHGRAAVRRAWR